MFTFGREMAD